MIGRTLLHYEVLVKVGAGGMGDVYRAVDKKLKRDVALKVLPSEMSRDPDRLARFQREAEAIAALNHPNIVTLYSVEEAEGIQFLTMELVEGKSLSEILTEEGLSAEKLLEIAIALTGALAAAHGRGITHRDLKPQNVMIGNDGRPKVLDFGLAKFARPAGEPGGEPGSENDSALATEARTQEGTVLGTVPYMSPEQVAGRKVDPRSDRR